MYQATHVGFGLRRNYITDIVKLFVLPVSTGHEVTLKLEIFTHTRYGTVETQVKASQLTRSNFPNNAGATSTQALMPTASK